MAMRWLILFLPLLLGAADPQNKSTRTPLTADQALADLLKGNERFASDHLKHPHQHRKDRLAVEPAQHPFAAILSCSDSRVPPEVVFDEGLGDLFVIRNAGNIVNDTVIGTIEYAVEHLGIPVIMVLGHSHCGAVQATIAGGNDDHSHIAAIRQAIAPAVQQARGEAGDLEENAVRDNVQNAVKALRESKPILHESLAKGKIKIVGAIYDLHTGKVTVLK
jgi:carbonic anhydrase